jgi:hypothetical protein
MNLQHMPFLPYAQPGESPLSLLRRAALGNGYPSLIGFAFSMSPYLDYSDTGLGTLARSPLLYRAVCSSLGLPDVEVDQVVYERCGCGRMDDLLWYGLRVAPGDLQFRRNRLCIACYLEHGYAFAEWDHVAAQGCAEHRVLLESACPVCHAPWSWNRDPLSCGCDPEAMVRQQRTCPPEPASLLHRIIKNRNQSGLQLYTALHSVLNWWKQLGLIEPGVPPLKALTSFLHGDWPSETDHLTDLAGRTLHPRILLAPLLCSHDTDLQTHGDQLLAKPAGLWQSVRMGDVVWRQHTAMAVLGIGRVPFARLKEAGHLLATGPHQIQADSINTLLMLSNRHVGEHEAANPLQALQARHQGQALSTIISTIKNHTPPCSQPPQESPLENSRAAEERVGTRKHARAFLTIAEASRFLGINTESVRGVIRAGLLKAIKGNEESAVQWLIERDGLQAFDQRYVFGSTLAREQNASFTTFSNRLRSAGAMPVSGPGIDLGATYLFLRKDIKQLDLESIRQAPYSSPAGRKNVATHSESADRMTTGQVADSLGVAPRMVRKIVNQEWLTPLEPEARYLSFRRPEVLSLAETLNSEYQSINEAADATGQSTHAFRRTWIDTGFVRGILFANRMLVTRDDLQKVLSVWEEAATGTVIGHQLGRGRHLCSNLKKMGRLKPCYVLGSGSRKVYLYPRNAPLLLHYQLES